MTGIWIDHHCHLPSGGEGDAIVNAARAAGVAGMVNVGTDLVSSAAAIEIAAGYEGVWATAGVHPHDAKHGVEGLSDLLDAPGVVAVGECGLDYHYMHSPADDQRSAFARQIELAHERRLPLVIHTREAWDDTFNVLSEVGVPERVVFHCFTGGVDEATRCLEIGAFLSFSGIVTFPSAQDLRDAALMCPLDRMMVETDSPYLAPVPHRGRPNRPELVTVVGEAVAELRQLPVEAVAAATTDNACAFYGLDRDEVLAQC